MIIPDLPKKICTLAFYFDVKQGRKPKMSHGIKIINLKINSLRFEQKQFVRRIVIMIIIRRLKSHRSKGLMNGLLSSWFLTDDNSLSNSAGFGVLNNKLQGIMGNIVTWF